MTVYDGKPTAYKISISEEQRAWLVLAMSSYSGVFEATGQDSREFAALESNLRDLPNVELECPNATHGLCV